MTLGSLFAGVGGIDLAFQRQNFSISWANELNQNACKIYQKNFTHPVLCCDIRDIHTRDLPPVDVIAGGFPCQPWSVAGKRLGFSDDRGNLFFDMMSVIEKMRPKAVFLENVKQLLFHSGGDVFSSMIEALEELGYHVKWQTMNSLDYCLLPQSRERLYIVAFDRMENCEKFAFPSPSEYRHDVRSVLDEEVQYKFYYTEKSKFFPTLAASVVRYDTAYQLRRTYVRENKKCVFPTLTASMGTGGHNVPIVRVRDGIRKITPREALRLQGFPDAYNLSGCSDSAIYKMAGNSVSVPVVEKIAYQIFDVILGLPFSPK